MSETQHIVGLANRARARNDTLCLATVVQVEGSAYRKPGARMLVTSSGERAGTISGGCLESEVSRKAWWLTAQGARVERYSSFADEDGATPYGLGCGGTVSLLLEQGEAVDAVIAALERTLVTREPAVVVMRLGCGTTEAAGTLAVLTERNADGGTGAFDVKYSQARLQTEAAAVNSTLNGTTKERLWAGLMEAARGAFEQRRSCLLTGDLTPCTAAALQEQGEGTAAYFIDYLAPPPAITIFGAGDDAQPIAELASTLGWRVSVVDGRAHLAKRERFPQAAEVRVLDYADPDLRAACGMARVSMQPARLHGHSRHPKGSFIVDQSTFDPLLAGEIAVILTHSYEQDRALLAMLLPRRLRYLGILGPRHRTERLLGEVTPLLDLTIEEGLARLHSPIGLDLGATDPATVALSIVAEIQAVLQGREVAIACRGERIALLLAGD